MSYMQLHVLLCHFENSYTTAEGCDECTGYRAGLS